MGATPGPCELIFIACYLVHVYVSEVRGGLSAKISHSSFLLVG